MRKRVLISEDITGSGIEKLKAEYEVTIAPDLWKDRIRLQEMIQDFDALIVRNQTQVTSSLLKNAKNLIVIGRTGAGYDNIDVKAAMEAGVVVCYSPEENAVSVAEHVLALLLALARKIPSADRSVKSGAWDRKKHHGVELFGKTLGILGLGKIGARVALRARAFGMRMIAHDTYLSPTHLHVTESGAHLVSFEQLLAESDFLTVHLPLNDETRGILSEKAFQKMKRTAFLINTSRGEILIEEDLIRSLKECRIAGAALDVREKEPPAPDSPFNAFENVILTPHTAGLTYEAQGKVIEAVTEDVDRVLKGIPALRYVNFPLPEKQHDGLNH